MIYLSTISIILNVSPLFILYRIEYRQYINNIYSYILLRPHTTRYRSSIKIMYRIPNVQSVLWDANLALTNGDHGSGVSRHSEAEPGGCHSEGSQIPQLLSMDNLPLITWQKKGARVNSS